jgi:hypothetical protein
MHTVFKNMPSGREGRWKTVTVIALFAIFTVTFFWPILFLNNVYLPISNDFVAFNFPENVFGASSLQHGEIPLWDPYSSTGRPYAADPNVGFFYPLKLILSIAVSRFSYRSMELLLILHYCASGVFVYVLARGMGASRIGGIVGGLSYMLSGFLVGQMEHPNIVITTTWLPLVFLFFRRAILLGHRRDAVWAGVFLAISIFGGHQQFSLMMVLWMVLWMAGRWVAIVPRRFPVDFLMLVITLLIAFVASAVQILPALELTAASARSQLTFAEAASLNLPPIGWVMLIFPHFFGPNAIQAQSLWTGIGNLNEVYPYIGVVAICLAICSLCMHRAYDLWFLAVIALMGLLLAAGNATPIYGLAYATNPLLRIMRVPGRFVYWFDLSIPLLAAFGVDLFRTEPIGRMQLVWRGLTGIVALLLVGTGLVRLLFAFYPQISSSDQSSLVAQRLEDVNIFIIILTALLAALLFLRYARRYRTLIPSLIVALVALDLFAAQGRYNFTTHDPQQQFDHPNVVDLAQREGPDYRIDNLRDAVWQPLTGLILAFPMASGLPYNPFDLIAYQEYRGAINLESRAYDFLAVKYLIVPRGVAVPTEWELRPVEDETVQVYENSQVLPRAFIVYESVVEPDRTKALELIRQGAFDPGKTVLLESGLPLSHDGTRGEVTITSSSNNSVRILANTEKDGYLVMSDSYYPGWRVYVDGRESRLLRANYAFRAVFLEPGKHIVRFEFDPFSWRMSLGLTLAAWSGLSLVGVVGVGRFLIGHFKVVRH